MRELNAHVYASYLLCIMTYTIRFNLGEVGGFEPFPTQPIKLTGSRWLSHHPNGPSVDLGKRTLRCRRSRVGVSCWRLNGRVPLFLMTRVQSMFLVSFYLCFYEL